jgi:NNP family nitrate/nitrite transporter-like MFS transporter
LKQPEEDPSNVADQNEAHAGIQAGSELKPALVSLIFLASMFFTNFVARVIFAPLMPKIEAGMGLGHTEAGLLFLMITVGCGLALFLQGFVPAKLTHRGTVILSTFMVTAGCLLAGLTHSYECLMAALFIVGAAAGIYLPSGIAAITSLVSPKSWGRALGIHELAPNLSFMAAPLIAEGLLHWFDWRGVILAIALGSLVLGLAFAWRAEGGRFRGQAPDMSGLRLLAGIPSFWVLVFLFCLGNAGTVGTFNILPLFLVDSHGMSSQEANLLVSYSRMATVAAALLSGWVTDALGARRTLVIVLCGGGLATLALAWLEGVPLVAAVFAQPIFAVCFFPPAFAVMSSIAPPRASNLAVALGVGVGFVVGAGLVPTLVGYMAELGYFNWGLILTGLLTLSGLAVLPFLRLESPSSSH